MKPDFKSLLEIYDNSLEKEKLIFLDVLNDLIKWIFELKKAKKIPQSIYIEELTKDIEKDMNFKNIEEFNTFRVSMRDFVYKWIDIKNRQAWTLNLKKERILLSKEIKKYYIILEKEELKEIHNYRTLLLNNFIKYWLIEIFISKNEDYHKLCKDFEKSISERDEKNKKTLMSLSNIKDKTIRKYLEKVEIDYWVEELKKSFDYILNDLELKNYLCYKKNLELLKLRINFKEHSADYDKINWILYYSKKEIHKFKKTKVINKVKELCKIVFTYPKITSIDFNEVNYLYNDIDKYYSWKIDNTSKIKKLIDNLNILIKEKTKNKSLLLLSQETIDNNHYIIRNF